jgi:hypothetical protein
MIGINILFKTQKECIAKIRTMDQKGDYDYSISMVYDIQLLDA